jgi:hypothetical protein
VGTRHSHKAGLWNKTRRLRTGLIDQGLLALAFANDARVGSFL